MNLSKLTKKRYCVLDVAVLLVYIFGIVDLLRAGRYYSSLLFVFMFILLVNIDSYIMSRIKKVRAKK